MIKIDVDNIEENKFSENKNILSLKNNKNPEKIKKLIALKINENNLEKLNEVKDNSEYIDLKLDKKKQIFEVQNSLKEKNKDVKINHENKVKENFNLNNKENNTNLNDLNNKENIINIENKNEKDNSKIDISNKEEKNLNKDINGKDENNKIENENNINEINKIIKEEDNDIDEKINNNNIKSSKILNEENNNISEENKNYKLLNKRNKFEDLKKSSQNEFACLSKIKKKKLKINYVNHFEILPKEEEFNEDTKMNFLKIVKPKGLKNLGSCCYMNATLQCFYHIKELTYYFLDNKKFIKRKNGLISEGLLDLIEGLSKNNNSTYYSPNKFRDNLIKVDNLFEGYEGKDSKDLVEAILYNLQEELIGDSDFPDVNIDQREERFKYLDLYYTNSKVRSIITDLFNFDFRTTRSCYNCGVRYYSFSNEKRLIFNLESVYNYCVVQKNNKEIKVSLDDCLTYFGIGNSYIENITCKFCKKKSSILSFNSFATLPEIFIFIMSRGHKETFECNVEFNEELDLQDLYISIKGITEERTTKYTLLGGTILYGSKGLGHTVAFCKHFDDNYYIFNDSNFYKTTFNDIKHEKIYLLFYQKNK